MNTRICRQFGQQQRHRRGVALVLVIAIVAVASIMGMAMLSASSLQAQVGSNAKDVALADATAEAGLEYATHKLLAMTENDIYHSRYWGSSPQTITFGSDWNASTRVSVRKYSSANPSVTSSDRNEQHYEVTATSSVTTASGNTITRTLKSRVNVELAFQPKHAMGVGTGFNLPLSLRVKGDVRAGGDLGLLSALALDKIDGLIYARALSIGGIPLPLGSLLFARLPSDEPSPAVPSAVKDYRLSYTHNGVPGFLPQEIILGTDRSTPITLNLQPSASNPAGIFYVNGQVTLGSNTRIRGTLYVTGQLHIKGDNIDIRAEDGYPALVVQDLIRIQGANRAATVRGLVWVKNGIFRNVLQSAAGSQFNVYGSLQLPAGATIDVGLLLFAGSVYVEYRPEWVNVPDFADVVKMNRTPRRVQVLDYGLSS